MGLSRIKIYQVENALDGKKVLDIQETLAKQLHENFRSACKAMGVPKGSHCHDHGFAECGEHKKKYFRKRAQLLLQRAENENPQTLGEAEQNAQALIFKEIVEKKELLCVQEVSAPGWSGLKCDHSKEMHDPKTGKCLGFLEFGWGDHKCDCKKFKIEEN